MATQTQLMPTATGPQTQGQGQGQGQSSVSVTMTMFSAMPMGKVEGERIPIVGHIITDEDMGTLQGAKLQPINLNKVVKLLTDPHSAMLCDRHVHALRKVVKYYSKGFVMKDLVAVFKLLNICADRIEENPIYIEPMMSIVRLCGMPFLKEKSSDEIALEQIAIESVAQLGYLMRVPCPDVRMEICNTLITFYCAKNAGQMVQRHQANTLNYNQRILEKSDVAETLIKSLALIEEDTEIRSSVLGVLQRLSRKSATNCDQMLRAEGANRLCSRLNDSDPSGGQLLFRSIDILWNILEQGSCEEFAKQLSNTNCISQLRDAFIHFLTQGFSHYQRQLRNDLLVIATLAATHATRAPFIETGFVKQLTLFATFQEVKSHHALVRHLKLMKNQEDFELKKLLINILVVLSQDPAVLPILSEGKLLLALFSYVKANERVMPPKDWTVAQFEEIQLLALSALSTLCPLMVEEYMMCQGSTRLLLLIEWCFGSSDEFGGHGNSFHGAGGRGNKRAQMRHSLRLIRSMVSGGQENILQDLADQGAITQLTTILTRFLQTKSSTEDSIDIEMQTDMLIILSALCENDMHRKELFGSQGVDVVVDFLNTDTRLLSSGLGHHRLLLSAVDCVWCAIVGCYVTEDYFLEKEGVFFLIDLLQNSPKNMHNLILGCLLDIAESPKTIAHIAAWRGPGDISAAHLLCNIWREEEVEMGVERDAFGAIKDIQHPLMGKLQEQQGVISVPANCPSQAIVDVSENMRAKLYALFCKTGFIELPGLTTEDHVTLTIVEHYMDFKLGEVWSEIQRELVQEEVQPVTPDLQALEAISRTIEERAEHVLQVQRELTEAQHQQDLIDEQEQYAEIRENHRQKEKAIKNFNDFVARTSNHLLLRAAKERQELSVDASRVQTNYKAHENFHATDISNLNTTTFSGRNMQVESTPLELTGGLLVNYDANTGTNNPRKYPEDN